MTPDEFEAWAGDAAAACDEHPTAMFLILVNDGDDGLECMAGGKDAPPTTIADQFDRWMAQPRKIAGMATKASWAPSDDEPTGESWALVVVAENLPAGMWVRRIIEDDLWWTIAPDQMPWFALATAGGLRKMLQTGEPLRVKQAIGEAVYQRPADGVVPPLDSEGRI